MPVAGKGAEDMNHTKGPWHVGIRNKSDEAQIIAAGKLIAVCAHECIVNNINVMEANARLISSAPDLLDACYAAFDRLEPFTFMHKPEMVKEVELLRAAITKATGITP